MERKPVNKPWSKIRTSRTVKDVQRDYEESSAKLAEMVIELRFLLDQGLARQDSTPRKPPRAKEPWSLYRLRDQAAREKPGD